MTTAPVDVADELRRAARSVVGGEDAHERAARAAATPDGYERELWETMSSLGWPGVAASEAIGGSGATQAEVAVLVAELGRHLVGSPLVPTLLAIGALERAEHGSARARLAPRLVAGEQTGTIVATAADGRIGAALGITATPMGATRVRLDGTVAYVPNGQADVLVVAASRVDGGVDVAGVDVERHRENVATRRVELFDVTRAFHEVTLRAVEV